MDIRIQDEIDLLAMRFKSEKLEKKPILITQ